MKKDEPKLKTPPRQTLQHIHLEELEAAAYQRDYEKAGALLIEAFRRLRAGSEFIGLPFLEEEISRSRYFARLAAAMTALIVDPRFHVSDSGYERLCIDHAIIDAIFETSAFDNSDHLAKLLSDNPRETDPANYRFSEENLAKWLLLHGMSSNIGVNFDELFGRSKSVAQLMFPLWIASIGQGVVLTKNAHDNREEMIKMGKYFEHLKMVPDAVMAPLSDAYMHCSYSVSPTKHDVKRTLSMLMERSLVLTQHALPTDKELDDRRRNAFSGRRPTMIVPLEHFGEFHAMYRCYAPIMRQLRPIFRLVAVAKPSALDEVSRLCFDDVHDLPPGPMDYVSLVDGINKFKPDIIYYPSLGMSAQWVGLSCVRMAPVQVMTLGHPATSMSPAMDYVFSEVADPDLHSEIVVRVPVEAAQFDKRPDMGPRRVIPKTMESGRPVRVAIPAMVLKLNVPFLFTLLDISERAAAKDVTVQYQFYPMQLGLGYWQARKHLRTWFPNCTVAPRADYQWYMDQLDQSDLCLVPFPFGGTNSTVDALWQGLPVVTFEGNEAHSRFDALLLERIGMGRQLITYSENQYADLALELIVNDQHRLEISRTITEHPTLEDKLFGEPPGEASGAFGAAFWHVFKNHEAIQASGNRVVTWGEITNGK